MTKMESLITFVKDQIEVQAKLANKYDEPYRKNLHIKTRNRFHELFDYLKEIESRGSASYDSNNRSTNPQKRIHLTLEEIDGLPPDLIKELNISEADMQELIIEHIIAHSGGILSLDKIMVQLYNRTKEVPKRNTITSRLYRMAGRGMIYNVPGKKGVYSTYELPEAEAKKMFGQDGEVEEPAPPASESGNIGASMIDKTKTKLLGSSAGGVVRKHFAGS